VTSLQRKRVALKPYSEYHFRVQASNRHGVSDWSEVATILPPPAAPEVRVENTKSQTVTLVWNVPEENGHEVQHYHVYQEQVGQEDSAKEAVVSSSRDKMDESGENTICYHAQQLQPNTAYVFYVRATSEGGLSDPSASCEVRTLPMAPPIPTMVTVDDIQTHSVRISWAIESDSTNLASACEVSWRVVLEENTAHEGDGAGKPAWSTEQDDSEAWTTSVVPTVSGQGCSSDLDFSFQMEELEADTLYAVQVRGVNEGGDGPWSPAVTQRTQVRRPKIPSDFNEEDITSTSVSLSWDVTEDDEWPVTAHQLRCVRIGDSALDTPWVTLPPAEIQGGRIVKMVEDLEPGVEYAFSLRALNHVGPGKPTPPLLATTLCEAPPPPQQPNSQEQTPYSISLDWRPPEPDNGAPVEGYCLQRRMHEKDDWETVFEETDQTNIRVDCDCPNTYYHFRVKALNKMGWSEWSDAIMVATQPPPPPAAPTGITVFVTHDSVTLKWLHHRGTVAAYEVQQQYGDVWTSLVDCNSAVAGQLAQWEHKRTSRGERHSRFPVAFTKENLQPGTEYLLRIAAKNDGGQAFSNAVRVWTEGDEWSKGLSEIELRQLRELCTRCQCPEAYEPLIKSLYDVPTLGALSRQELSQVLDRLRLTPRQQERMRRTLSGSPHAPSRPFRTTASFDTLTFAWDAPSVGAAAVYPVVEYIVQYQLQSHHASGSESWEEVHCGGTSCVLQDLQENAAYVVRVAASNEPRGSGPWSDVAVARTQPLACDDLDLREMVRSALHTREYADKVASKLYHEQWTCTLLKRLDKEKLADVLRAMQVKDGAVCALVAKVSSMPSTPARATPTNTTPSRSSSKKMDPT